MIHSLKLLDIIFSLLGLFILHRLLRNRTQTPFPPGPKGLPLIGNTLDIPRTYEWLTFSEWAKRWGAIIYLRTLGHPIIILSSYEEAVDMLEKKSSIYSDRPVPITAMNAGFGSSVVLTQYGDNFRVHRRFMNKTIGYKDTLRLCHRTD
ncbi:hypothetical protein QCA50_014553 [Cerrena zonata]|uniref:Cytochrome P450 n=1 Tax=Cerrena zonata TaxID=2478898 RepID=A0AAW0FN04_9APHY